MRVWTLVFAAVVCAASLSAQGRGKGKAKGREDRAQLEQNFREQGERVVRDRLKLTDGQLRQLREVNGKFAGQRRGLFDRARDNRAALREELARGGKADEKRVARLNAEWMELEQERLALQRDEQGELAKFLTPVQAAQYVGLQAQLRKRMREMTNGGDSPE